jgi:hypothetical protein
MVYARGKKKKERNNKNQAVISKSSTAHGQGCGSASSVGNDESKIVSDPNGPRVHFHSRLLFARPCLGVCGVEV